MSFKIESQPSYLYTLSTPIQQVETKNLTSEYIEQAIDVFTRSFCNNEPMTHHLGLQYFDFQKFARIFVTEAAKQDLSMVLLENNQVVALTIVEDMGSPIIADLSSLDPRFGHIFEFLGQLTHPFFCDKTFKEKNLAHLFVSAVDPNHQGKGLSKKVNFATINEATKKGFDGMCCEFTHSLNEQGTLKYIESHKVLLASQSYSEYIVTGKDDAIQKPFAGLSGGANAYLWELQIGGMLRYQTQDKQESFIPIKDVKI